MSDRTEIEAQELRPTDIGQKILIEFEDDGEINGYLTRIDFQSLHRATLTKEYQVIDLEITRRHVQLEIDGDSEVELELDDYVWISGRES
ncbi:hypothetical protein [Pseudarthrobacter sp. LMD1-1-1.1]|uniref:hypothetical protein n=1 Tax=Pseudarthrobacter sp. LMD1-1-1.1 TaxID=3135242 RepID=UPI0034133022